MNDVAVVMITCEKFKQAWIPFFTLFKKYWKDCPYNIYMITDYGSYDDDSLNLTNITLKKDDKFSSNLKNGLGKVKEEIIIYFQEDYFFNNHFDTKRINDYSNYMKEKNIDCIRLAPCPGPTIEYTGDPSLGILQPGDSYRVSTQTAIWKKEFLLSLLVDGECGADFEIKGTERVKNTKKTLLSVWREQTPSPYYITGIVRGVWQDDALQLLKDEGISIDHINKIIR